MLRDLNHIQIQKNDKKNLFNKKGKQREATVIFLFLFLLYHVVIGEEHFRKCSQIISGCPLNIVVSTYVDR